MHAAQKKQSVHHLKKNNNEKGFAVANSFCVIGISYHTKCSARRRRGACNENVATQPHLAQDSVETESFQCNLVDGREG